MFLTRNHDHLQLVGSFMEEQLKINTADMTAISYIYFIVARRKPNFSSRQLTIHVSRQNLNFFFLDVTFEHILMTIFLPLLYGHFTDPT